MGEEWVDIPEQVIVGWVGLARERRLGIPVLWLQISGQRSQRSEVGRENHPAGLVKNREW